MTLPRLRLEQLEARDTPALAGSIDPTFATNGVFNPASGESMAAVAVQPDGKIVAAGVIVTNGVNDFSVIRLNPDGSPDETFGDGGRAVIDFTPAFVANDERATAVAVLADGRIVVAGRGGQPFPASFVARLTPTGGLDTSFSTDGLATVEYPSGMGPSPFSHGMAVDAQNRVLIAGTQWVGVGSVASLVRLTEAGDLDPAFGSGGRLQTPGGTANRIEGNGVAVLTDGTIAWVGTGTTVGGRGNGFVGGFAARVNDAGTSVTGFTSSNHTTRTLAVLAGPNGTALSAGDEALQSQGSIPPGPSDFGVNRWVADGTADQSFGTGGFVAIDLGGDDTARALALDASGRVIVVGGSTTDFPVVRLNPDGTPDTAFNDVLDGSPTAYRRFGGSPFSATAVATQGNDVIAVGSGQITRILGERTLDSLPLLAVSGANGVALLHTPTGGVYNSSPTATVTPFAGFAGSVRTATGDVDGDGITDLIAVTGPGTPIRVTVISGKDNSSVLVSPFDPFGGEFTGGGFVAAADFDGDGRVEFAVSPDQGGGPRVSVYSVATPAGLGFTEFVSARANFLGIEDANFRGGARVALGDVNADGVPDLAVAAGFQGGPRVAVFDGKAITGTPTRLVGDFFAFPGTDAETLRNGAFVALGDVDGDGFAELIFGGGPGGAPRVFILDGGKVAAGDVAGAQAAPVGNFFVDGNTTDRGGVRVAVKNADGDARADVVVGSGEGSPSRVRVYFGTSFVDASTPAGFQGFDPFGATLPGGVFVG